MSKQLPAYKENTIKQLSRYEHDILICCARIRASDHHLEKLLNLLAQDVDWQYLFHLCFHNRIRPLFANTLTHHLQEHIPDNVNASLQAYLLENMQRNLSLSSELVAILSKFGEKNIKILPLKGVTLADQIYGNISLREIGDLDLLVTEELIKEGIRILESLGYEKLPSQGEGSELGQKKHHYNLVNWERDVFVELHWNLADSQHSTMNNKYMLWNDLSDHVLQGQHVYVPRNEDLLIYLCTHGYRHQWERLSWIVDVCELLRIAADLDWQYVIETAKTQRNWHKLALGLRLAHMVADGDLPDSVLDIAPLPNELEPYVGQIWQSLFLTKKIKPGDGTEIPSLHFATLKYHLAMSDSFQDRLRYLRFYIGRWLTPMSGDKEVIRLPKQLSFLYVPIRIIRLVGTYGGATLRTLIVRKDVTKG